VQIASADRTGPAADGPEDLFVSGVAFDSCAHTVLPGVEVRIGVRKGEESSLRPVVTDSMGRFRLGGLGPGNHLLTFECADYHPVEMTASLAPGKPLQGIEVLFERGQSAWGLVQDLAERPLSRVVLEWSRSPHGLKPIEVLSGKDGRYKIGGLESGRYFVRLRPAELRVLWDEVPWRQVTGEEGAPNRFDFTSDAGASLRVLVIRDGGAAVPGAQVRFRLTTPARGISGFLEATDTRGETVLRGLPPRGALVLDVSLGGSLGEQAGSHETRDLASLPAVARIALADPAPR
jgi:hypothetical protein